MSREVTNKLIEQVEEGILTWEQIARSALCYLSEDDVKVMAHCNELIVKSTYKITVTGEPTDPEDIETNPCGEYTYEADDEDDALDQFHSDIPISCLNDFDIEVEQA